MSKYVIIKKSFGKNPYSGKEHLDFYCVWAHKTNSVKPYFSASLGMNNCIKQSFDKKDIAKAFKEVQNYSYSNYKDQPKKQTKRGHIFILKLNSPKLKDIIEYSK